MKNQNFAERAARDCEAEGRPAQGGARGKRVDARTGLKASLQRRLHSLLVCRPASQRSREVGNLDLAYARYLCEYRMKCICAAGAQFFTNYLFIIVHRNPMPVPTKILEADATACNLTGTRCGSVI
jgi:hypothetical protein